MADGTGWQPDPFGIHEERYVNAEGTPTKLVRDRGQESYDHPPKGGTSGRGLAGGQSSESTKAAQQTGAQVSLPSKLTAGADDSDESVVVPVDDPEHVEWNPIDGVWHFRGADGAWYPGGGPETLDWQRINGVWHFKGADGGWHPEGSPTSAQPAPSHSQGQTALSSTTYLPKTSPMAIASLVLSLLWLGGIGSILAIVFGRQAHRDISAGRGQLTGSVMAMWGIILGWVGLVCLALIILNALSR